MSQLSVTRNQPTCNIICVRACFEVPSFKCVSSLPFPSRENQCVKRNEDPAVINFFLTLFHLRLKDRYQIFYIYEDTGVFIQSVYAEDIPIIIVNFP